MSAQREPVGSVHQETARLFAALEGAAAAWSRGEARGAAGGAAAEGANGPAGAPGTSHLPTTCGTCPLCLALDRLGRSRPEVLDHLTDAVQALGAALAAVTRPAPAADPDRAADTGTGATRTRTESIDVTD